MFLLLVQNSLQETTLGLTLRLGGHRARVVRDEHEAINLIKTVQLDVCGIVLSATGAQGDLARQINAFCSSGVFTPIYLVGTPPPEGVPIELGHDPSGLLSLSVCSSSELLEHVECNKYRGGCSGTRDGHSSLQRSVS